MKIAFLGHKSIPSRQGGIEIVVEELATRMAELGNDVTVYNRNSHHINGKEFDSEKIENYKGIHMKYAPTVDKKRPCCNDIVFFCFSCRRIRKIRYCSFSR